MDERPVRVKNMRFKNIRIHVDVIIFECSLKTSTGFPREADR